MLAFPLTRQSRGVFFPPLSPGGGAGVLEAAKCEPVAGTFSSSQWLFEDESHLLRIHGFF